jgi:hypothetical protein
MIGRDTRTPSCCCPYCGHGLNAATGVYEDAKPRRGDLTVCVACGGTLVFTRSLAVRRPLPGELSRMLAEDDALSVQLRAATKAIRSIDSC